MIAFEQFLTQCDISDNVTVKKRDIDRVFISTTAEKHGEGKREKRSTVVSSGLDRDEWIEALIRVAKLKFVDTKVVSSTTEAFDLLFSHHLKFAFYVDPDEFRKDTLYSVETEDILSVHLTNLKTIYNQYCSVNHSQFGRLLNLDELHQMMDDSGLTEKGKISHDQAAESFVMAKFLSVDEKKSNLHKTLTFADFLECIVRICFIMEDEEAKKKRDKGGFDFMALVKAAHDRATKKGRTMDDKLKKLTIGLRENGPGVFKRTLKLVFSDDKYAMKHSMGVIVKYVRAWKQRKREKNKELDLLAGWTEDGGV